MQLLGAQRADLYPVATLGSKGELGVTPRALGGFASSAFSVIRFFFSQTDLAVFWTQVHWLVGAKLLQIPASHLVTTELVSIFSF